ncbi:MAG: ankyrin repeat domain-containing protein [Acidobacteriota bacterium]|nr:ankyrin repeat domain-containing protein [Acidobacteriota bacterium]
MSNHSSDAIRVLPDRPSLRHLKGQARDLMKSGNANSQAEAHLKVARMYGFASWPKLKRHVELLADAGQLKNAIDQNDLTEVQSMLLRSPALHNAPLGYAKDGPLTWVAECRVPPVPPNETRLAMAKWMIENGSDVHRGGDAPLMRAALDTERIPMMRLLVSHGADVNGAWHGAYPIIFAACEALEAGSLQWLVDHGGDPNCGSEELWKSRGVPHPGTALDYVLGAYIREPERLGSCIDILLNAGGRSKHEAPAVLAIIRGRLDELTKLLDADRTLVHQRFPSLDFGATAARMLTLRGATLLHVAAEYGNLPAARLLLDRGADVNAAAATDGEGTGGQTAIFHAATQRNDTGLPMVKFLIKRGADLKIRAKLPGHYETSGQVVECTSLGYALLFPGDQGPTSAFLRDGAVGE